MKKITFAVCLLFCVTSLEINARSLNDDCVDQAISSLEDAEAKLGTMMSDIEATEFLNASIAMCETFPWYW